MTTVNPMPGVRLEDSVEMKTEDGVVLVADVWRPDDDQDHPVLLQRLPYGRRVASAIVVPHPAWFARHGYTVVVQDVRGTGDSGGDFDPFVHETADGVETIEWAARLPGADGRVATYGFSYQGYIQLPVAASRPPSLRAIAPLMTSTALDEGWFYESGVPKWPFLANWSAQCRAVGRGLPTRRLDLDALPMVSAFGDDAPPWFLRWATTPPGDSAWEVTAVPDWERIEVPAFVVTGWFDNFASGSSALMARLGAEGICGPWIHRPWGTSFGGTELEDATPDHAHDAMLAFFDRTFGIERAGPSVPSGIRCHVAGRGWVQVPTWPPPTRVRTLHAGGGGHANGRHGDGVLESTPIGHDPDVLVVEPFNPYPGELEPLGDERVRSERRDVLCYLSAPLEADVDILGEASVEIEVAADVASHDVVASLVLVEEGRFRRLATGATRVAGGDFSLVRVSFDMHPTGARAPAGSRLRLDISCARFPAFARNPHTGDVVPATTPAQEHRVATVVVHGARLQIPVLT